MYLILTSTTTMEQGFNYKGAEFLYDLYKPTDPILTFEKMKVCYEEDVKVHNRNMEERISSTKKTKGKKWPNRR